MLVSSKETRKETRCSFLRQFATWSAVAGGSGLGATPIFGAEPESCAGRKPPATAIPWKPDTNPILPRPAASTLTDADVTRLRHAYQALRDLTDFQPDDPRGWLEQADKHCSNCGGGLDQQAGEEIHGSWLFLPWHRACTSTNESSARSSTSRAFVSRIGTGTTPRTALFPMPG